MNIGSNIHAAFALHPCPCFQGAPPVGCPTHFNIDIPIYFVSGTLDTICLPAYVKDDYDKTTTTHKGFAEMKGRHQSNFILSLNTQLTLILLLFQFPSKGITHLEPMNPPIGPKTDGRRWAPYVGNFFRCHLLDDAGACDLVYGSGADSLCQRYEFSTCESSP